MIILAYHAALPRGKEGLIKAQTFSLKEIESFCYLFSFFLNIKWCLPITDSAKVTAVF